MSDSYLSEGEEKLIIGVIVFVFASVVSASVLFWFVGNLLHDGDSADFSLFFSVNVVRSGPQTIWPDITATLFWVATGAIAVTLLSFIGFMVIKARRVLGGAAAPDYKEFYRRGRAVEAKKLRRTLKDMKVRNITEKDVGSPIGMLDGKKIYSGWEDVEICLMAPRTGKSTAIAIPKILAAPGVCIITSNKADVRKSTLLARERNGTCWTFDPMGIAGIKQTWFWDPLAEINTYDDAIGLASIFLPDTVSGGKIGSNDNFFPSSAREYIALLFLAAAKKSYTLRQVSAWLAAPNRPSEAIQILAEAFPAATFSQSLTGLADLPNETLGGVIGSARTALDCLKSEKTLPWVTPGTGKEPFNIERFLQSGTDTLYLLSSEAKKLSAAPLIAAFTINLLDKAADIAEKADDERFDPPLAVVLDEAANICKIPNLPTLYSHFGSRGIIVTTILQNTHQAIKIWGDNGWRQLWEASTIKMLGPGLDDAKTLEDISRLIGEHETETVTTSKSRQGTSQTFGKRKERIMPPSKIRALGEGEGLLLATSKPIANIKFLPWYNTDVADQINSDRADVKKENL